MRLRDGPVLRGADTAPDRAAAVRQGVRPLGDPYACGGNGLVADASATTGRVVVRPVCTTASVRLVRLG